MLATELLLKLTDETNLDFLVLSQLGNWNEDNDDLLAIELKLLRKEYIRKIKVIAPHYI